MSSPYRWPLTFIMPRTNTHSWLGRLTLLIAPLGWELEPPGRMCSWVWGTTIQRASSIFLDGTEKSQSPGSMMRSGGAMILPYMEK